MRLALVIALLAACVSSPRPVVVYVVVPATVATDRSVPVNTLAKCSSLSADADCPAATMTSPLVPMRTTPLQSWELLGEER